MYNGMFFSVDKDRYYINVAPEMRAIKVNEEKKF